MIVGISLRFNIFGKREIRLFLRENLKVNIKVIVVDLYNYFKMIDWRDTVWGVVNIF